MPRKLVTVKVRLRNSSDFAQDVFQIQPDKKSLKIHQRKVADGGYINNQQENWDFGFDGILHNASQEAVHEECAAPTISAVLDGYNGTILAYGQTGAGKTFTMTGASENYKHRGVIPRAISQVFKEIADRPQYAITVRISYCEIYNENLYDLLRTDTLAAPTGLVVVDDKTGGSIVKGLTMQIANNEEEALDLLFEGETNRSIAEHQLNKASSRSHCIFTIHFEARSRLESSEKVIFSKLNLVDLAGSERLSKTNSSGTILKEAMYINKSLTFLEQVIIALGDKKREHIPYRQSKLTNVLKDALGGNCNTVLIANIWGEREHVEETISTLRFATRMMCVANAPVINVQFDPMALLRKYEKEIRELKQELAMHDTLSSRSHVQYEPYSDSQKAELQKKIARFLVSDDEMIEFNSIRDIREIQQQFRAICKGAVLDVGGGGPFAQTFTGAGSDSFTQRGAVVDEHGSSSGFGSGSGSGSATAASPTMLMAVSDENDGGVGDVAGSGFGIGLAPNSAGNSPAALPLLNAKNGAAAPGGAVPKSAGISRADASAKAKRTKSGKTLAPSPLHSADGIKASPLQQSTSADDGNTTSAPPSSSANSNSNANTPSSATAISAMSDTGAAQNSQSADPQQKQQQLLLAQQALLQKQYQLQQQQQSLQKQQLQQSSSSSSSTAASAATQSAQQKANSNPAAAVTVLPSRTEEFESFKRDKGEELNKILNDNKASLRDQKTKIRDLTLELNSVKSEIDVLKSALDGKLTADAGDKEGKQIVIDEQDFIKINNLQQLKQSYRKNFDTLKQAKSDADYCSKLVDQCRQKLMSAFENWYESTYGTAQNEAGGSNKDDDYAEDVADVGEKFDKLQLDRLAQEDPESYAFYNAKKTAGRKLNLKRTGSASGRSKSPARLSNPIASSNY